MCSVNTLQNHKVTKWLLVLKLFFCSLPSTLPLTHTLLTQCQQVPCLFLFGDSLFDNGNNNLLLTTTKVNYRPYGIDYPDGPTGRFSNGRNQADFLTQLLGFNQSIPPFAKASRSEILKGVNYASGSAGIRDETGKETGDVASLSRQLQNHNITITRITSLLRDPAKVNEYLNKCLYAINMGSNDYINNYLLPESYPTSRGLTPQQFASSLIQQYTRQLKTLYDDGARKIVIFGLLPVGCAPYELATRPTHGSPCVEFINSYVQLFNNMLRPLIDNLNRNLTGSHFTYIDTYDIFSETPVSTGISVTKVPCCAVLPIGGLCIPNSVPCAKRSQYRFWDGFHPTEAFNQVLVTSAYNGTLPSNAYPINIRSLVLQL